MNYENDSSQASQILEDNNHFQIIINNQKVFLLLPRLEQCKFIKSQYFVTHTFITQLLSIYGSPSFKEKNILAITYNNAYLAGARLLVLCQEHAVDLAKVVEQIVEILLFRILWQVGYPNRVLVVTPL